MLAACRVLRLQPGHNCCKLGELSSRVGWKHGATVAVLEERRKVKSKAFYEAKKKTIAARAKVAATVA
jgi:large subunit ribosomal protein L13Ae